MEKLPNFVFNFNVGVLGHVDSGKTSLAKALSTVASTACFDKNPQSKERGITLDLGFSSFSIDVPHHLRHDSAQETNGVIQVTLVDCPGHASLIRTIIGGAQIIDLMLLVIDITKGMQTQTAECLVIGEITCNKMIVVLNKIDLIDVEKRASVIERMTKRMVKTLESTPFAGCPVVAVSAKPGGSEASMGELETQSLGINELIDTLSSCCYKPDRNRGGAFMFAVDHCFSIRGHGTVMTGTVISGSVAVNDSVEIPALKITKKVKSMQMFRKPVDSAIQGDRVGICVTQFDSKLLERGLVCKPGSLPCVDAAIISVRKIEYFKGAISTKAKFHITIGHETVMGRISLFGLYGADGTNTQPCELDHLAAFDFTAEYRYQNELISDNNKDDQLGHPLAQFALVEFEHPITCGRNFLVIGSKLDTDIHSNTCRIAFHGHLLEPLSDPNYSVTVLPQLKVYKERCKEGVVERRVDEYTVVCRGLFKKESKVDAFVGLKVKLSTGDDGIIEGGFGQSGKFKVRIPSGLGEVASTTLAGKAEKKGKGKSATVDSSSSSPATSEEIQTIKVLLSFKRYIYDPSKRMLQC